MRLKDLSATLIRRWYFVLLALVCTAVASFLTVIKVGPTYEAKAAVLLLPPVATVQQGNRSETTVGNPYLLLDGLSQIRDIVIRTITAQATHEELCQPRGDPGYDSMREQLCSVRPEIAYEATPDYTNRAPIILITVEAKSTSHAVTALRAVVDRVPGVLTELQSGLKLGANGEITSTLLIADSKPEIVRKDQIRAGIAIGAGTLGLGLLLIGLLDSLLTTRRSKKAPPDESVQGTSSDSASPSTAVLWTDTSPVPAAVVGTEPARVAEPKAEPARVTEPNAEPARVAEPNAEPARVAEPNAEPARVTEPNAEPARVTEPNAEPARVTEPNAEADSVAGVAWESDGWPVLPMVERPVPTR